MAFLYSITAVAVMSIFVRKDNKLSITAVLIDVF